jgi:hypothetical protein
MLVLHVEHDVTARPIAHSLGKILARRRWALTLALHQLLGRGSPGGRLLTPALPILPVLPASLLATAHAGTVLTARLHATPTLRGTTARLAAITDLRMRRRKLPLASLEQAAAITVTTPRLWPKRCRIMK